MLWSTSSIGSGCRDWLRRRLEASRCPAHQAKDNSAIMTERFGSGICGGYDTCAGRIVHPTVSRRAKSTTRVLGATCQLMEAIPDAAPWAARSPTQADALSGQHTCVRRRSGAYQSMWCGSVGVEKVSERTKWRTHNGTLVFGAPIPEPRLFEAAGSHIRRAGIALTAIVGLGAYDSALVLFHRE
jgi:hypothetical protein